MEWLNKMEQFFSNNRIPLICTPLTGKTEKEIIEQVDVILPKKPDLIEWRADFFMNLHDTMAVLQMIERIKEKTEIPLLFTIRSVHEGGEDISLSEAEKVALLQAVCEQSAINIIDYEVANEKKDVAHLREVSKKHGKTLILSYHNFKETPDKKTLLDIARKMEVFQADVMKLAVMPQEKSDVFRLLQVTRTLDEQFSQPIITMSMGELGVLSRIIGWTFGSVVTFAVGVSASAPGQVPVDTLRELIENMRSIMPNW